MMKKLIALVLALVLCFTMLTGCGKTDDSADTATSGLDYAAAFKKYDPNTVVATVYGDEVTWSEYFFMLYVGLSELEYYFGAFDWSDKVMEGYDYNYEEYSKMMASDSIVHYHTLHNRAALDGIVLTDAQKEEIAANMELFKKTYCGEDATDEDLNRYLLENKFATREVYDYINDTFYLNEELIKKYVGVDGEKQTDEDIRFFVETAPYVTAKHILIKTVDENNQPLPEEEKAAAEAKIYDIYDQLKDIKDSKELADTFDRLMKEHNQDEGVTLFPDGYTFTKGEMVAEFEAAAFALEEYQMSNVVPTEFGYHILLRLPTSGDSKVSYNYEEDGFYNITYYASQFTFSRIVNGWMEEADLQWKPEFENLTMAELFA